MDRIAGIDFGNVRIGVAISDTRRILASPFKTFQAGKNHKETAKILAEGLKEHFPLESIVIGLPLHLSGKESDMSQKARELGAFLKELLNIEIIFWDERLSSLQVQRTLKEAEFSRKKQVPLLDKMAAAAILQNYLDSRSLSLP